MIDLIVWSKDRACQLHLLLESIKRHAPNLFNISVILTSSNRDFADAYSRTMTEFNEDWIDIIVEKNFREDTLDAVEKADELVAFATDDTVIYRPVPVDYSVLQYHFPKYENETFSFRLGLNTIVQDPHQGSLQPPLNRYVKTVPGIIHWNALQYHPLHNYGYPLSLDLHIFRKSFLSRVMPSLIWNKSNALESALINYRPYVHYMASFEQSVAVNIPANNMSTITRAGEKHPYSQKYLNEEYLNGKTIDLDIISKERIVGCHQEINLVLRDK